jgi:NADH dehydrogenase [ubiquinone] 1 alpha subcomplex assembly factor 7
MLGIWCVVVWQQLGCPSALQLVELGPGRGTLMADLLRGTAAFTPFAQALQVCASVCVFVGGGLVVG